MITLVKFEDWVRKQSPTLFSMRDWAADRQYLGVGDSTTPEDRQKDIQMVAFASTVDPDHWRHVGLDVLLITLAELYGKDHLIEMLQGQMPYGEIKDALLSKKADPQRGVSL